jgi:hypothetical protein
MTYISRDPFARTELHRETEAGDSSGCAWCGNRNAYGKLYRYRTEHDGGRTAVADKLFCSIGCLRQRRPAAQ